MRPVEGKDKTWPRRDLKDEFDREDQNRGTRFSALFPSIQPASPACRLCRGEGGGPPDECGTAAAEDDAVDAGLHDGDLCGVLRGQEGPAG